MVGILNRSHLSTFNVCTLPFGSLMKFFDVLYTLIADTLHSWIHLSGFKGPNVTIMQPATCGSNTCPPSFIGQFCETEIG